MIPPTRRFPSWEYLWCKFNILPYFIIRIFVGSSTGSNMATSSLIFCSFSQCLYHFLSLMFPGRHFQTPTDLGIVTAAVLWLFHNRKWTFLRWGQRSIDQDRRQKSAGRNRHFVLEYFPHSDSLLNTLFLVSSQSRFSEASCCGRRDQLPCRAECWNVKVLSRIVMRFSKWASKI